MTEEMQLLKTPECKNPVLTLPDLDVARVKQTLPIDLAPSALDQNVLASRKNLAGNAASSEIDQNLCAELAPYAPTVGSLLESAKKSIKSGLSCLRSATDDMAAAQEQGATQRQIAAGVGKSEAWVSRMLKWRDSGYADETPFARQSKQNRAHKKLEAAKGSKNHLARLRADWKFHLGGLYEDAPVTARRIFLEILAQALPEEELSRLVANLAEVADADQGAST